MHDKALESIEIRGSRVGDWQVVEHERLVEVHDGGNLDLDVVLLVYRIASWLEPGQVE